MSQTSEVLVVGHPDPNRLDFGAANSASLADAKKYLERHKPSVIVIGGSRGTELDEFCNYLLDHSPETLWIVSTEGLSPSQILQHTNFGQLYDMIEGFDDPALVGKLQSALETSGEISQRRKLTELTEEQSRQLKRLSSELEARVQRRHKALRKSLKVLEHTKTRLEAFHKALLSIHRSTSIMQMEQSLNEALSDVIDMVWVRVRFESQTSLGRQAAPNILAIPVSFHQDRMRGEVLFSKADGKRFTPFESDFLHELSEALALALSRTEKLTQAESLKAQWQATFDAIPHPLCLTTSKFEILKLNLAYKEASSSDTFRSLIGKQGLTTFFGPEFHPAVKLEPPFSFRTTRTGPRQTEHYEVSGDKLSFTQDNQEMYLVLLRSVTEEVRIERRILETSKLAELGIIGSSIAHELNNPLGGMLSFLQLILMDLKELPEKADLQAEVKAMEEAVLRCRDIILNLLSFARKQELGDFTKIDLRDVIERSVKLIELQSKSKGIQVEILQPTPASVLGSANALSQALCNLLQNSIDAISERLNEDSFFPGCIRIELDCTGERYRLRLSDNGTGIRPEVQSQIFNPLFTTRDPSQFGGMGLTTAFTIVSEHRGNLEILSQSGSGTTAIISLPRLDLPPERRLFDGEI